MANLKEVRDRIGSVKNTQQITKAMKMVSAAKLRRAQTAIQQMRPYANKLNDLLRNILSSVEGDSTSSFGQERPVERACIVLVTSNRGLCGAFNTNIIKEVLNLVNGPMSDLYDAGKLDLMVIGKKGYDFFKRRWKNGQLITDHQLLFDDLTGDNIGAVSQELMDRFSNEEYDKVYVAYGRFKNAAMQFAEMDQWLPVAKLEVEETGGAKADYTFEPGKKELLEYLVPSILQTQFQKFLLDTHASEHGARMTAMDKATENAEELLKELKLSYNKARQEAITNEILEIVGGAAALEGG